MIASHLTWPDVAGIFIAGVISVAFIYLMLRDG